MNDAMKDKFMSYQALKIKEKEIKAQITLLMGEILPIVQDAGEVNTDLGKFSVHKSTRYEYPAEVNAIGEQHKAAQEEAKQMGTATPLVSESVKFTAKKV